MAAKIQYESAGRSGSSCLPIVKTLAKGTKVHSDKPHVFPCSTAEGKPAAKHACHEANKINPVKHEQDGTLKLVFSVGMAVSVTRFPSQRMISAAIIHMHILIQLKRSQPL